MIGPAGSVSFFGHSALFAGVSLSGMVRHGPAVDRSSCGILAPVCVVFLCVLGPKCQPCRHYLRISSV